MPFRWLSAMLLSLACVLGQVQAGTGELAPTEPPAEHKKHGANEHGQKKAGSDSDALLALRLDLTIWTIVIFVLLMLVLKKFAWGPMLQGLRKREDSIRQALDDAKTAREETERLRIKFKTEMEQKLAEIPAIMEKARRDAEKLGEDLRAKAAIDIQAERDRGRRDLEIAHDQVVQDLFNQSAQLATLIAGNVLARSITPEDHQRMFSIAMEELKNSGPRFRQDIV